MCWWGAAYALGPSINHDMDAASAAEAARYIRRASGLASQASDKERALIAALAQRYGTGPRERLDAAYEREMRAVAQRLTGDADALTLLADAIMVPRGRDFWDRSGAPRAWTVEILALLERALAIAPDHPGANHFYVHALEDSPTPERARASAERLLTLAPGVAHLVHMPAHVLLRLGDYAGASQANRSAIAADRALLEVGGADPAYMAGYVAHNHHFLWFTSLMAGASAESLAAAAELGRYAGKAPARRSGTQQQFLALALYAQVRFGRWEAILATPRPAPASAYTDGVWQYARGMAWLRTGRPVQAREALQKLKASLRGAERAKAALKNVIPLAGLLAIAARLLEAEIAAAAGDFDAALAHARAAVLLEAAIEADEPPAWHMPARHTLGALLLEAGQAGAAERVYRDDLRVYPENGWSLYGLTASLERQGRDAEADDARARLARAWAGADVAPRGSRF
jgi:tetratricopeptide (TPR) repeat protein